MADTISCAAETVQGGLVTRSVLMFSSTPVGGGSPSNIFHQLALTRVGGDAERWRFLGTNFASADLHHWHCHPEGKDWNRAQYLWRLDGVQHLRAHGNPLISGSPTHLPEGTMSGAPWNVYGVVESDRGWFRRCFKTNLYNVVSHYSWVSYQSSGGNDKPQIFSGFCNAMPETKGRSGSM